jgi:hypothetical protein
MAPLRAKIVMQLGDTNGRFAINGNVSGFDATKLNILLKPMALATVEKGHINKLDFNFNCNNYTSDGTLVLLYEDLKMNLLRKDSAEKKIEKKELASFVANLVIKNANPLRKQKPRTANVHLNRDVNRSFFNMIWKSIFAGAKESVGMKAGAEKK